MEWSHSVCGPYLVLEYDCRRAYLVCKKEIRRTYEKPMHMLMEAAERVADGDFSVYVPALHTADKLDYLDIMIMDFNKMVEELGSIETLKTDFVSNVSHEMKTPIAIIKKLCGTVAGRTYNGRTEERICKVRGKCRSKAF